MQMAESYLRSAQKLINRNKTKQKSNQATIAKQQSMKGRCGSLKRQDKQILSQLRKRDKKGNILIDQWNL